MHDLIVAVAFTNMCGGIDALMAGCVDGLIYG